LRVFAFAFEDNLKCKPYSCRTWSKL